MANKKTSNKKGSDKSEKKSPFSSMCELFDDIPSEFVDERPITYLKTGHPGFDSLLGGGLPQGKFVEYWGAEGSGKTTICLQQAVYLADCGHPVFYLDYERGLTQALCQSIPGVMEHIKARSIIVLKPTTFNEFISLFKKFFLRVPKDMKRPVVFVDSVVAMQITDFMSIDDVESNKPTPDTQARTKLVKVYKNVCDAEQITVVWINQRRANIQMGGPPNSFADKDKATGGTAYKHALDVQIKLTPGAKFYNNSTDKIKIGHDVILQCSKNKFRPGFEVYKFPMVWGNGLSLPRYYHNIMKSHKLVTAARGVYKTKAMGGLGAQSFENRDLFYTWLLDNSDAVFEDLESRGFVTHVLTESE